MNKTEILNIVNEPSKHIHIVKIDGKDSIVYSSKFVELLELIPTMLTKADMVAMLDKLRAEIKQTSVTVDGFLMHDGTKRTVLQILDKYKTEIEE